MTTTETVDDAVDNLTADDGEVVGGEPRYQTATTLTATLFIVTAVHVLIALYAASEMAAAWLATSLPGIGDYSAQNISQGAKAAAVFCIQSVFLAAFLLAVERSARPDGSVPYRWSTIGRTLKRPDQIVARWARVLHACLRHLGLLTPARTWVRFTVVGVLAAIVVYGGCVAILHLFPDLANTAPDERHFATQGASPLVQGIWGATISPLPEEIALRGPLLVVVLLTDRFVRPCWARVILVVAMLVATTAVFGWLHIGWSLSNAVTAGFGGLIFGAVTVWQRSLWPAIIAHALFNFTVCYL